MLVSGEYCIILFKLCEGLRFPGVCLLKPSEKENQIQIVLSAPNKGAE